MIIIGITGGIGTGKSTVSGMLSALGAVVVDADKVGHEAYQPHTEVWQQVVAAFGPDILGPNDQVDRGRLGQIVFNDPRALERLNRIMHPRMHDIIKQRLESLRQQGAGLVVLEAAVLIEASWTDLVDQVWVTAAPEAAVIERLGKLGIDGEQVRARIRAQMAAADRARHADVVIDTGCDLSTVKARVGQLWQGLGLSKRA